jgi:hypothetical protein
VIYTLAAYSITIGVLALYGVVLQHRNRAAATTLARAGRSSAPDPRKGFNLGALLLAPFWMFAHGMRLPGVVVLMAWIALWPLFRQAPWIPIVFVGAIPLAAGAALGLVGNRIAFAELGAENADALSASQLPWALAGIVLHVFVFPWAAYLAWDLIPVS